MFQPAGAIITPHSPESEHCGEENVSAIISLFAQAIDPFLNRGFSVSGNSSPHAPN